MLPNNSHKPLYLFVFSTKHVRTCPQRCPPQTSHADGGSTVDPSSLTSPRTSGPSLKNHIHQLRYRMIRRHECTHRHAREHPELLYVSRSRREVSRFDQRLENRLLRAADCYEA
jgi:hypothetical protein